MLFNYDIGPGVRTAPLQRNRKIWRFMNWHRYGNARRRSLAAAFWCLIGAFATPVNAQPQPLTLVFGTNHLGTYQSVSEPTYGVWSNGLIVSDTNIYVSFQWSNAGPGGTLPSSGTTTNFSAVIGNSGTLEWKGASSTSGTQWAGGNWYFTDVTGTTTTYQSGMSQGFTVAEMNAGAGTKIQTLYGNNMFIEYGQNTISENPPPTSSTQARYTDVEWTFVTGSSFNNLDLTTINNAGAALNVRYIGTSSTSSVGFTAYTEEVLPTLGGLNPSQVFAAGTPAGALSTGSSPYIASVPQGGSIPAGTSFYATYPAYIASVLTGTLGSPLLTNQPGGSSPTAAAFQQAQGFTSATTGTVAQQVAMFFRPTFTAVNSVYDITLTGSIASTTPDGTMTTWYGTGTSGALTINVSNAVGGVPAVGFYGYLANGNVNNSVVTLGGGINTGSGTSGGGWQQFSTDFWQGGGIYGGTGNQGGPSPELFTSLSTSGTTDSTYYGQIVQRALGDLQELLMIGAFGNETQVNLPAVPLAGASVDQPGFQAYVGPLGGAPSQNVWSAKANAYLNTSSGTGYNTSGEWVWTNSESVINGIASTGAIYSNPYDDRFTQYAAATVINMDSSGGTLTIDLREIAVIPEPSALALLSVAGATLGGLGWLRRRRPRTAL